MTWDQTDLEQTAFIKEKQLMAQVQALTVTRNREPFKLGVTVAPTGYAWGLWQRQDDTQIPIGFCSQL
jgi:hypothetical protein